MSQRFSSQQVSLVMGWLLLIVAVAVNPWSIEQLLVPDKQLQGGVNLLIIGLWQATCGLLAVWILRRRPRFPVGWPILILAAALALVAATALHGTWQGWSPKPWKAAGLPMVERLRILQSHSWEHHNQVGIEKYRWLLKLPLLRDSVSLRFKHAIALLEEGDTAAAAAVLSELKSEAAQGENSQELHDVLRDWLAVARLREGEQANCIARHSADVCILPIRKSGIHLDPSGSMAAITELEAALADAPNDLNSRWLLNIAYMTLGEYPGQVPERWLIPPTVFESEYDIGHFRDIAPELGVAVRNMAGGVVSEDFNGDGFLDLLTSSTGHIENIHYFENQGDGSFIDKTVSAGLAGQTGGLNLAQADYDNDGFVDVLVPRGAWRGFSPGNGDAPNSLLRNNGNGTFTDTTEESGLLAFHPTQVAVWVDFDNDGWIDLFLGNESQPGDSHPAQLYRNNRGIFEDVTVLVGLKISGMIKGAAWQDYDNDGYADVYISRNGEPNLLYRNRAGKGGQRYFEDVTERAGVAEPLFSFPTWFFDFDNDGWQDIFVGGFAATPRDSETPPLFAPHHDYLGVIAAQYLQLSEPAGVTPKLFRNNHDGTFSDVTAAMSLDRVHFVMGANFGDLDNDGYLDLYLGTGEPSYRALMPNRMFRSNAGRYFQDVTTAGGFGHLQKGHGIAFGDLDNDGDQDIYAQMGGWYRGDAYQNVLFLNPGHGNNWITLRLQGTTSNAAAIGARVRVIIEENGGSREIYATVSSGGSFGASSLQTEIGLGEATAIERLEIFWPASKLKQVFSNVPLNQILSITEGNDYLDGTTAEADTPAGKTLTTAGG